MMDARLRVRAGGAKPPRSGGPLPPRPGAPLPARALRLRNVCFRHWAVRHGMPLPGPQDLGELRNDATLADAAAWWARKHPSAGVRPGAAGARASTGSRLRAGLLRAAVAIVLAGLGLAVTPGRVM